MTKHAWQISNRNRTVSQRNRPRLGLMRLEDRLTPTLGLLSALTVGNDVATSGARDVAVDAAGNSYLTGLFSGTMDFDPTHSHPGDADILTSAGGTDIFVAKYTANNLLIWARRMGGVEPQSGSGLTETGEGIALDGSGNVFITGKFQGSADFGSITLNSAGSGDGFAAKLNSNGVVTWANRWGSNLDDWSKSIDVDGSGNAYVVSSRNYSLSIPNPANGYDVLKFGATGSLQWSKYLNTRHLSASGDIAVNAAGNVFVTGGFWGNVDFDPSSKTKNVSSGSSGGAFALKLNSSGSFQWVSPFIGQGSAYGQSIATDNSGNIIVGGYYSFAVDFNPGSGTATLPAAGGGFITKLNSTGGYVWARALENASAEYSNAFVYSLDTDSANNVYASGAVYGSIDFNPGVGNDIHTAVGDSDSYALKLTSAGNYAWAPSFGGDSPSGSNELDVAWGIAVAANGTVHIAGVLASGTTDLDPDDSESHFVSNDSHYDFYLLQLIQP